MVKKCDMSYPKNTNGCWELVEQIFINGKKEQESAWDEHCYIPIDACIAITSMGRRKESLSFSMVEDAAIMAAAAWIIHKQIYTFHPEMERLLFEQAYDFVSKCRIYRGHVKN